MRDDFRISNNLPTSVSRSYTYDALDRQISATDALGRTQTTSYDAVGNIVATTDALGHTTTYAYDNVGNRTALTDALNNTTRYVYDELNRQVRVINAQNHATTTAYDVIGNILGITDSVGNTTSYTYDALNRQLSDTNSLGKTRSFSYDAVGNRVQSIDRNGRKIAYSYDALNRQTSENWLDNGDRRIDSFNYTYDAVGNLSTVNSQLSTVYTYTYDLRDRLLSVDHAGTVGVPTVKFAYNYDAAGNLVSVTDAINGTLKSNTAYTYDVLNRVRQITQSGSGVQSKRVDMSHDAANQLTGLKRYGDLAGTLSVADSSWAYDAAGRLTSLIHQRGASSIASYGFDYDVANRVTQKSGTDGTSDYTYDSTNQLTGVDNSSRADEAYSYDANGNRTNAGYGTGTNNQLLTDGVYNYTYDDEGNRTKRTEIATGKVTEYVWDYRNRLTAVVFKDAAGNVVKTISYSYDVNNQRIGKSIDGVTTERYVYDRNQISLVFDGAGVQTHRYLYGTQVDQVLADETPTGMVWALADNLGTVRDIIDGSGVVLNHITYDSYGRVISQTNPSVEFRYGYTGREQDNETGLDYYRARYYDSAVGRFISEDPIGFNAGDTNIYRYVGNSPTNFVDPSGLRTEIYVHSGKEWYGHTAINVNGTVYTFGRYSGTVAKVGTGNTIGEGYLYVVNEKFYLNSSSFTDSKDTLHRFSVKLSPAEEQAIEQKLRQMFDNNTKKVKGKYYKEKILGKNGLSSQAHGRIIKENYNFLFNNCNQTVLDSLPKRVGNEISIRATQLNNISALTSPPHLKDLLNSFSAPTNLLETLLGKKYDLITPLKPIPPGRRLYD